VRTIPTLLLAAAVGLTAGCTPPEPTAGGGGETAIPGNAPAETPHGTETPAATGPQGGAPAAPAKVADKDYKALPGGLKYAILKPGDGPAIKSGQTAAMHYTGWLKDGKKFDSSLDRGEPFVFPLGGGQVIKGWDQGIVGMKVGEKRQLVIPPDLGYGETGAGADIPPNSTLVFDVELLRIE
jgi:FKBP-type peptidyl-prolyl cis-trans isomerase